MLAAKFPMKQTLMNVNAPKMNERLPIALLLSCDSVRGLNRKWSPVTDGSVALPRRTFGCDLNSARLGGRNLLVNLKRHTLAHKTCPNPKDLYMDCPIPQTEGNCNGRRILVSVSQHSFQNVYAHDFMGFPV